VNRQTLVASAGHLHEPLTQLTRGLMKQLLNLTIEKLIYEGYGLGHDKDGKAVFVRKVVPGDTIKARVHNDKKHFAYASIEEIVTPGKERIAPRCPHFLQCGGCDYQNLSYENQLKEKQLIFNEIFSRAGLSTDIRPVISGGNSPYYYRNVMRYFGTQTKDGTFSFGMHDATDYNKIIPIHQCFLMSEKSNEIMQSLAAKLNEADKPDIELRIRETKEPITHMIELITREDSLPLKEEILMLLKSFPTVVSVYHTINRGATLTQARRKLLFGSPVLNEKIGRFSFYLSPESFFQTNAVGVKTLYDLVKQYADPSPQDTVLDLYCGTGTIGIYLSTLAKKVIGIESVQEAINDARGNAKLNNVCNAEFICQKVDSYLSDNKSTIQQWNNLTIVLDPPRNGLTKEIIELLSKLKIDNCKWKIIYVSCNPSTFVRDCRNFEQHGWKLEKVQPIDMFPQTHHIECVGLLENIRS